MATTTKTSDANSHWTQSVVVDGQTLSISCSERFPVTSYTEFLLNGFPDVREHQVLDFGTGCGVLALAAALRGARQVIACDISEGALALTQENSCAHGYTGIRTVLVDDRRRVGLRGLQFDTILSNPASLPTRSQTKFFWSGGKMGLDMIYMMIDVAARHLVPGGRLRFVHTSLAPLNKTLRRLRKRGLAAAILRTERVPFRPFYEELIPTFARLRSKGHIFYDVMNDGTHYELLYLIEATHFE